MTAVEETQDSSVSAGEPVMPALAKTKPIYDGQAGELFKLVLVNTLLNIVTLGIFRFWAKTRLRHFLWSHVSFAGDRFEYTGRGKELLIGFVIAIIILAPLGIVSQLLIEFVASIDQRYAMALAFAYYPFILFLVGVAIFRARRYRLSRTVWRGIRGGQTGSATKYGLRFLGYVLLSAVTLGLALPVQNVRLQSYLTENTWFGDKAFRYEGRAGELFRIWIKYWFLYPFTLGISYIWYQAAVYRYSASRTSYERLRFRSELRGGQVFLLYLAYSIVLGVFMAIIGGIIAAIIAAVGPSFESAGHGQVAEQVIASFIPIVTIIAMLLLAGLLGPLMITHPLLRIGCETLTITGDQDFSAIAQSRLTGPGRGEGLADAFDVGDF